MLLALLACLGPGDSQKVADSRTPVDTADSTPQGDSTLPDDSADSPPGDTQDSVPVDSEIVDTEVGDSDSGGDTGVPDTAVADFSLLDVNPNSARYGELVSPRDYIGQVSGFYFTHAT